jgi:ubiquinone biosynthesis protein
MNIFRLNKNYKNLTRLVKIVTIIARYGFSAFLARIRSGLGIVPHRAFQTKPEASLAALTEPERVRMAIEELGPAFIKMGQILSLRPDIIPAAYAAELEKLLDRTPPVSFSKIKTIVEDELDAELGDIFSSFEETPVASGSIAQVHCAVLKEEGQTVAVKVLKPRTRQVVETDLSIIRYMVRLALNYIPELKSYRPQELIKEFSSILHDEMNFIREAHLIDRFARFFSRSENGFIHIPKVYRQYTERSVLVMEYIDGIKISDIDALKRAGMNLQTIAENGAKIVLKEIFEFGFFHADPHPGNIFVLSGNVVAPVDFGVTGYVDEEGLQFIANVLVGIIERDVDRIIRYLQRYEFVDSDVDTRRLKTDIFDVIDTIGDASLEDVDVVATMQSMFNLLGTYHVRLPGEYFLIMKTLLQIDALGRQLHPSFNVTSAAKPFVHRWFIQRYHPRRALRNLYFLIDDLQYSMRIVTTEMGTVVRRLGIGKFRIPIYHENLDRAVSELDRTGNRMSFAIIIAALLLSSSILVQAKVGPLIRGYPVIGLLGFLFAAVMGLWLLIGIIKSGKL